MRDEPDQQRAYLSPGDVAALIQLHSLPVKTNSPLLPYTGEERVTQASLKQRGLHRAAWRDALTVLAAPRQQVRVQIPAPAESFTAIYYGAALDNSDGLVGCWLEEDGLRIAFPWTSEQILAMAWQVLLVTTPPPADELALTLSLPGLTALVAAVDSLRAQLFRSYLYRETDLPLELSRAGLVDQLELGLGKADSRWLVTLLNLVGSPHFPLVPQALPDGVAELVAAGLLSPKEEGWQPATGLQRLALQWRSPLPAFALESLVVGEKGQLRQYGHQIIIRGDGPLWRLAYDAAIWQNKPQVQLTGIDPLACFDGLAQLLAAPTAVPAPPTPPVSPPPAEATLVDGADLGQTIIAPPTSPWMLTMQAGASVGRQFVLDGTISMGRNQDNIVFVDDRLASRYHARIVEENGRYFIEDLNSSNGMRLNGQKISRKTALQIGDQIKIGDTLFVVGHR